MSQREESDRPVKPKADASAPWASYTVAQPVDARKLEFNARTSRKATKVVTGKIQRGLNVSIAGLSKGGR